ncbi:MAG: hypothetical protein R2877_06765 [Bdellovibrionota bacterium]
MNLLRRPFFQMSLSKRTKARFSLSLLLHQLRRLWSPLIGLQLILKNPSLGFCITGALLLHYIALRYFMDRYHVHIKKDDANQITFVGTMRVLRNDHALLLFLLGNIFMLLGFANSKPTLRNT